MPFKKSLILVKLNVWSFRIELLAEIILTLRRSNYNETFDKFFESKTKNAKRLSVKSCRDTQLKITNSYSWYCKSDSKYVILTQVAVGRPSLKNKLNGDSSNSNRLIFNYLINYMPVRVAMTVQTLSSAP